MEKYDCRKKIDRVIILSLWFYGFYLLSERHESLTPIILETMYEWETWPHWLINNGDVTCNSPVVPAIGALVMALLPSRNLDLVSAIGKRFAEIAFFYYLLPARQLRPAWCKYAVQWIFLNQSQIGNAYPPSFLGLIVHAHLNQVEDLRSLEFGLLCNRHYRYYFWGCFMIWFWISTKKLLSFG